MSRGLGSLQRFIKEQIYRKDGEYRAEQDRLDAEGSDDGPEGRFWLFWWEIKWLISDDPALNKDAPKYRMSRSMERSAKRALHSLYKRGEVARIHVGSSDQWAYITPECDKGLDEAVAKMGR
jgi:hypothetical protein